MIYHSIIFARRAVKFLEFNLLDISKILAYFVPCYSSGQN